MRANLIKLWAITLTVVVVGTAAGGGYVLWEQAKRIEEQQAALAAAERKLEEEWHAETDEILRRVEAVEETVGERWGDPPGMDADPTLWDAAVFLRDRIDRIETDLAGGLERRVSALEDEVGERRPGVISSPQVNPTLWRVVTRLTSEVDDLDECVNWVINGTTQIAPRHC